MMTNPSEIARIAADEKREARILEVAQQLRDAAQAEFDQLVARHTTLITEFPAQLQEIDQRSTAAYAHRTTAMAAASEASAETSAETDDEASAKRNAEVTTALDAARAACDVIDEERRAATIDHIEQTERSRQTIAGRTAELLVEHWMERAAAQVASEGTS